MHIDLGVFALIAISAVLGYHSGAVRQLAHWIGLGVAIVAARPAAAWASPRVAALMQWPLSATGSAMRYAMLPVLFLVVGLFARIVLDLLEPGEERGALDQVLGIAIGLVRGAVISYAVLSAMVYFQKPLTDMHVDLRGSRAFRLARDHNLLAEERADMVPIERAIDSRLERAAIEKAALQTKLGAAAQR